MPEEFEADDVDGDDEEDANDGTICNASTAHHVPKLSPVFAVECRWKLD